MGRTNSKNKELPINIIIDIIDGSYDDMGAAVIQGRYPVNQNEIALGINAARQIGKELGDISEVYIQGNKHKLTIVGIDSYSRNWSMAFISGHKKNFSKNPCYRIKITRTVILQMVSGNISK